VVKTLLAGGVVVTCDAAHAVYPDADVVMDGDRISYVGPSYSGQVDRRVDASGFLIMPGLVNAHTHSPMTLFRGLADDVDLHVFLQERVWPREVKLTPDEIYAGSVLAGIEMLKSGVTSYVDMYFWEHDLARAAVDVGIRAMITPAILDSPAWEPILGSWESRTQDVLRFCREWEGREGRIHTGFGPHAPYTLSLEALSDIAALARDSGFPVHIHLVESELERDQFNARGIGSTAAALESIGFFDGPVLAAHSIWIDDGDLDIYRRKGVGVAHCPISNAKLGAGIAPTADMLAHELQVGLGTDGAATNNNMDLWEEMRFAPLLAKALALNPTLLPSRDVLWMATRMGARAAQLDGVGELTAGCRADIVMVSLSDTTTVPLFAPSNYVDLLVYSMDRSLVTHVWVAGRQVVDAGVVTTVDEESARAAAQRAADAVSRRVAA
jgi:5-methylthioadenosine/S-adenosylhomocysteine deaminase